MKISSLSDKECSIIVIKMLIELRGRMVKHNKNSKKEKIKESNQRRRRHSQK